MQKLILPLLVLCLASTALGASIFQLDVCNKHRTVTQTPGTTLTVTADGVCIVTSQVLSTPAGQPSCSASTSSTAVVWRFPCKEQAREKQATGPALNIWGSLEGVPKPTKSGMIITEAAPARKQTMATPYTSSQPATPYNSEPMTPYGTSTSGISTSEVATPYSSAPGICSFLTLNPGLYYHKSPPVFTYGYVVSGVPCQRASSAAAVTAGLEKGAGVKSFATTYSLWLKPTLPAPPAGLSQEAQTCNLVMSVLNKSFVSVDKFPCNMVTLSPEELGDGCCYNAGGPPTTGRGLLSHWEKAVSYRRAFQH